MKKTILLGIIGLAAVGSSYGQGFIQLDNYGSTATPLVTYGTGSDGAFGVGVNNTYTMGLYFANGDVRASMGSTAAGNGVIDPALALASGSGSSAVFSDTSFGSVGQAQASLAFNVGAAAGGTVTVEVIAWKTSTGSYANSLIDRGHSAAFLMTTAAININPKPLTGDFMTTFNVTPVPEPSVFALSGLGAAALMLIRRKK
jgi:hypothetical protein